MADQRLEEVQEMEWNKDLPEEEVPEATLSYRKQTKKDGGLGAGCQEAGVN